MNNCMLFCGNARSEGKQWNTNCEYTQRKAPTNYNVSGWRLLRAWHKRGSVEVAERRAEIRRAHYARMNSAIDAAMIARTVMPIDGTICAPIEHVTHMTGS